MRLLLRAGWMLDGCPLPRKKQGVAVMIRQQVVGVSFCAASGQVLKIYCI